MVAKIGFRQWISEILASHDSTREQRLVFGHHNNSHAHSGSLHSSIQEHSNPLDKMLNSDKANPAQTSTEVVAPARKQNVYDIDEKALQLSEELTVLYPHNEELSPHQIHFSRRKHAQESGISIRVDHSSRQSHSPFFEQ